MPVKIATVLHAEDDPNDAFLVERAFKKAELCHKLIQVIDGQEAVDYLGGAGRFRDRIQNPLPDLLLLDLKMPRLTGFEVLEWLALNPSFKFLPVVILSSSDHETDVRQARQLGAVDYLRKPGDPNALIGLVRALDERWLQKRAEPIFGLTAAATVELGTTA